MEVMAILYSRHREEQKKKRDIGKSRTERGT
jgi:hypothetical protein